MSKVHSVKEQIKAARGLIKADLVIKDAKVLNIFTEQFEENDVAIKDGYIVGIGR